ncbi:hypothetical protein GCM10027592_11060 [Spirosoma flavus]
MESSISPDATYLIEFDTQEMAMSHWTYSPIIYQNRDRARLFSMGSSLWSASSVEWISDSVVSLRAWLYPGRIYCDLLLDLERLTGKATKGNYAYLQWKPGDPIIQPPVSFEGGFAELTYWLNQTAPYGRRM